MIGIVKEEELLYISKINGEIRDKCSIRNDFPESSLETLCLVVKSVLVAIFLIFAWYRPPNSCGDIFRQLEESMQVLDRENNEIILLGDTNCDILPNYLEGDSLNNNLPTHSLRILEFYDLFGFKQLIETGTKEKIAIFNPA